ncbi:polysaccharide pyruvyl transferase family protein [Cryobacterium sp. PH29-G1]|uniref:polysaccharide pyruvyl transferase family protein n=1 Tax=Cryobacterium sp. PH29-G1 TaxID=3046211 RepID=UPI0024B9779E|nr:polysaccharide pyruvyl transferase family protein [Cryobacterium sp. PH29-G1]MDJ0350958.1 polysaccharide pyruvyl transferase family protein [Cryobacterium sp. PH29-G1]
MSRNTGDIAIGVAAEQLFAARGVTSHIVNPFSEIFPSPLVIGGGELVRVKGDPFYDAYRQTGGHILNAAGVWSSADDLGYLNEYAFVSARSEHEVQVLRSFVSRAEVLPCATTLLRSDDFVIPGIDADEPVVGIHMVPHSLRLLEDLIPIIDAIPHKKVFIPFTHYNGDQSFMKTLPFNMKNSVLLDKLDPLQLHSVIRQMDYVVVSSLHASIYAYSQNIPFASVHQKKAEYYFQDRDLSSHLVRNDRELRAMLARLESETFDFSEQIASDSRRVNQAFDRYAEILGTTEQRLAPTTDPLSFARQQTVLFDQAQMVIGDRDLALGYSESRRLKSRRVAIDLQQDNAILNDALTLSRSAQETLQAELNRRDQRLSARIYRRAKRELGRLASVFKRP